MQMKVSDYIMRFLEEKGILQAFILPGGGAMHLVESIGNSKIEYVCCQHEQAAAIAAEAYGQHTNHPALVLVTSGPGVTNAITGVTAGWIDSTPMFLISGQAKRCDLVGNQGVRQIGSQEVPTVGLVKNITKYAAEIMDPESIRYHLEKAFALCTSGRPGPVWLSVPLDVQGAKIESDKLVGYEQCTQDDPVDGKKLGRAAVLLRKAKRPLVLAGNGIKLAGAEQIFYQLVNQCKLPVLTTWKTADLMDADDPLYFGHPGIMGDRGANRILQTCDLLLVLGSRMDTSITAFNEMDFGKSAKKIVVDIDENEIKRMKMEIEIAFACDAGKFIEYLLEKEIANDTEVRERWLDECRGICGQYPTISEQHYHTGEYVSAYYFIRKLCAELTADDVIVPESSGAAGEITYQAFRTKKGQKIKNAAGLGSMGFGLPYAIGACIANHSRRTILINGDAAFQLNIQELETVKRLRLPVKIFIWNNGGYASIRSMQKNNFEGHFVASSEESGFSVPDTGKIADAYGFKTYKIHSNDELDIMLKEILNEDGSSLCELEISPDETVWPRVKARRLENGSMVSGKLEDM